jgi:hypothetical protein
MEEALSWNMMCVSLFKALNLISQMANYLLHLDEDASKSLLQSNQFTKADLRMLLHVLIMHRDQPKKVKYLLDAGADINQCSEKEVHLRLGSRHDLRLTFADVEVLRSNDAPLGVAMFYSRIQTANYLMRNGADLNKKGPYQMTIMEFFIRHSRPQAIYWLLKNRVDPNELVHYVNEFINKKKEKAYTTYLNVCGSYLDSASYYKITMLLLMFNVNTELKDSLGESLLQKHVITQFEGSFNADNKTDRTKILQRIEREYDNYTPEMGLNGNYFQILYLLLFQSFSGFYKLMAANEIEAMQRVMQGGVSTGTKWPAKTTEEILQWGASQRKAAEMLRKYTEQFMRDSARLRAYGSRYAYEQVPVAFALPAYLQNINLANDLCVVLDKMLDQKRVAFIMAIVKTDFNKWLTRMICDCLYEVEDHTSQYHVALLECLTEVSNPQ